MSTLTNNVSFTEGVDTNEIGSGAPSGNVGFEKGASQTGFFVYSTTEYTLWLKDSSGTWTSHQSFTAQDLMVSNTVAWGAYEAAYIQTSNSGHKVFVYPRTGSLLVDGDTSDGVNQADTLVTAGGSSNVGVVGAPIEQFPNWSSVSGHIIPDSNANFDIGSAENKVRHLFLSDNSLWVGDAKVTNSDGKIKTRKRKKDKVPKWLSDRGVSPADAQAAFPGYSSISQMTMTNWMTLAKQQSGGSAVTPDDVFDASEDFDTDRDWEDYILVDNPAAGDLTINSSTGQTASLSEIRGAIDNKYVFDGADTHTVQLKDITLGLYNEDSSQRGSRIDLNLNPSQQKQELWIAMDRIENQPRKIYLDAGQGGTVQGIYHAPGEVDVRGTLSLSTETLSIPDVAQSLTDNAAAIAAIDTSGIATNAAAIAAIDTSGIATNAAAIAAIDTSGIATNAANIAAIDTSGIATNAANIAAINADKHVFTDHVILKEKRDLHFYDETDSKKGEVAYNENSDGNFIKVALVADSTKSRTININAGNTDGISPEGTINLVGKTTINRDGALYNVTDMFDDLSSATMTNTSNVATCTGDIAAINLELPQIATNTAAIAVNTAAINAINADSTSFTDSNGNANFSIEQVGNPDAGVRYLKVGADTTPGYDYSGRDSVLLLQGGLPEYNSGMVVLQGTVAIRDKDQNLQITDVAASISDNTSNITTNADAILSNDRNYVLYPSDVTQGAANPENRMLLMSGGGTLYGKSEDITLTTDNGGGLYVNYAKPNGSVDADLRVDGKKLSVKDTITLLELVKAATEQASDFAHFQALMGLAFANWDPSI